MAYLALKEAGYEPDVVRAYGFHFLPDVTNARREVRRLTGESYVPILVLDDGQVVADSSEIIAWAEANPADAAPAP